MRRLLPSLALAFAAILALLPVGALAQEASAPLVGLEVRGSPLITGDRGRLEALVRLDRMAVLKRRVITRMRLITRMVIRSAMPRLLLMIFNMLLFIIDCSDSQVCLV